MLIAAGGSGLVATLKINISHQREREAEKNTACVRYREIVEQENAIQKKTENELPVGSFSHLAQLHHVTFI